MREHGTLRDSLTYARRMISHVGWRVAGAHSCAVPLRLQGNSAMLERAVVPRCSFTLAQTKLLETFADQAVIAIENVRLFKELQTVISPKLWNSRPRRVKSGGDRQLADGHPAGASMPSQRTPPAVRWRC